MAGDPGAIVEHAEILDESHSTLADLNAQYNNIKKTASDATDALTSTATFKGMGEINEIVANAMMQIQEFTDNGKQSSMIQSASSKALAIIDPNNSWAGKWLNNKKNDIKKESIKQSTMEEIANSVISSIEAQREDVVSYMESIVNVRNVMIANRERYENLLNNAISILPNMQEDTRDELDNKSLINRLNKSLMQVDTTITTKINPLVASARIAITEIDAQLPDIEHDLKYEGSLKVAQQSLADLIGMAKTVKNMTEKAGDAIRKDIHETTLESIKLVGDVMIDTGRMKAIHKEEAAHMKRVNNAMIDTKDKINQNFDDINQLSLEYKEEKQQSKQLLLEGYSEISDK